MEKKNAKYMFQLLILKLNLKKNYYEKINSQFIKDRADESTHFTRGIIEGINEALNLAETMMPALRRKDNGET